MSNKPQLPHADTVKQIKCIVCECFADAFNMNLFAGMFINNVGEQTVNKNALYHYLHYYLLLINKWPKLQWHVFLLQFRHWYRLKSVTPATPELLCGSGMTSTPSAIHCLCVSSHLWYSLSFLTLVKLSQHVKLTYRKLSNISFCSLFGFQIFFSDFKTTRGVRFSESHS